MILSISGRMGSGKSTLCNELISLGFIKISFADFFKNILSSVYEIDIYKFYDQDEKNKTLSFPLKWDKESCHKFSTKVKEVIPFEKEVSFSSIREMLQYIGTDVLRKYDPEFHIRKTIENLEKNKDYCFDDCRFLNEKKFLEGMGALCIFIFRPSNFDFLNHQSEIELNWTMFDYVIENTSPLKSLVKRFRNFVKFIGKDYASIIKRDELLSAILFFDYDIESIAKKFNCSRDKIIWLCERYLIKVKRNIYSYDERAFLLPNEESSYFAGLLSADGCIKNSGNNKYTFCISLTNNDLCLIENFKKFLHSDRILYKRISPINGKYSYELICSSQKVVENIKLWNLKPRKSIYNKIPDIIKNNGRLMDFWLIGLIDGDGCITKSKNGTLTMRVLCSEEIATFLVNEYKDYNFIYHNDYKGIKNLCEVSCHGKFLKKFYKERYDRNVDIGLKRKWNKIEKDCII